jgi:hypothetical protein
MAVFLAAWAVVGPQPDAVGAEEPAAETALPQAMTQALNSVGAFKVVAQARGGDIKSWPGMDGYEGPFQVFAIQRKAQSASIAVFDPATMDVFVISFDNSGASYPSLGVQSKPALFVKTRQSDALDKRFSVAFRRADQDWGPSVQLTDMQVIPSSLEGPERAVLDAAASIEARSVALEKIAADGDFTNTAAWSLIRLLDSGREPRALAAKTFYLIFYDLSEVGEAVRDFLLNAHIQERLRFLLVSDPNPEVRRYMAQTAQLMVFRIKSEYAEAIASAYLPVLMDGMSDPSSEIRNEIVVALGNLKGEAPASFGAEIKARLLRLADSEPDESLRDTLRLIAGSEE